MNASLATTQPLFDETEPPVGQNTDDDPILGSILGGRFSIIELIGCGGMGRVYKARQSPSDRIVALKILNPLYAAGRDPEFQKRFFLEAAMTARLQHPNLITVLDYGRARDGIFYIAMEYIPGVTLARLLESVGSIPWERALNITRQVCRALRHAHAKGLLHRDLKPGNIMLLNDEEHEPDTVKLLDFGLVKSFMPRANALEMSEPGSLLGSPMYMAPEQARNHSDPRTDIYSLGLVLYQMLVGRAPFQSKQSFDIILKQVRDPPPPLRSFKPELQIPAALEAIIFRCLEKDPNKRYQSIDEMLAAIRGVAEPRKDDGSVPLDSAPVEIPPPVEKWSRGVSKITPWRVSIAALVMLPLVSAIFSVRQQAIERPAAIRSNGASEARIPRMVEFPAAADEGILVEPSLGFEKVSDPNRQK